MFYIVLYIGCLKLVELVCDSFHDLVLRLGVSYFLLSRIWNFNHGDYSKKIERKKLDVLDECEPFFGGEGC